MAIVKKGLYDVERRKRFGFSDLLDRFFDTDLFTTDLFQSGWNPRVDIVEDGNNLVIKADIPGVESKDLNVMLENDILTIEGKRENEYKTEREGYHKFERSYGSFSRSIRLPKGVDAEKISAEYNKGVLNITIPMGEKAAIKKINVKAK